MLFNHNKNFVAGEFIEHVHGVYGDEASRGAGATLLGLSDETVDLELGSFDHEIHAIGHAYGVIVWEQKIGKIHLESLGDMAGKDSAKCCGDSDGPKLGRIVEVFVKAE